MPLAAWVLVELRLLDGQNKTGKLRLPLYRILLLRRNRLFSCGLIGLGRHEMLEQGQNEGSLKTVASSLDR